MKLKMISQTISSVLLISAISTANAAPTSGDYVNDKTRTFTNNFVQRIVKDINGILCIGKQTIYDQFTNQAAYLAQVDMNACGMGDAEESSTPMIMNVVVESTNSNNIQTVKMWFDGVPAGENGEKAFIEAKMVITATPTTSNPYGEFTFNYIGNPVDVDGVVNSNQIMMKGMISSSIDPSTQVASLKYYDQFGNDGTNDVIKINFVDTGNDTGYGKLTMQRGEGEFNDNMAGIVAFDTTYLENLVSHGQMSNDEICYDRTNYSTHVYGYGLYNADGSRVGRGNSGFPVIYTKNNEEFHGWLGFHGLWLGGVTFAHGDDIEKINIQTGERESGTLVVSNGRLMQRTVQRKTLANLNGVDLMLDPINPQNTQRAIVRWNSSTEKFSKVAEESCSQQTGCQRTNIFPAVELDAETIRSTYRGWSGGGNEPGFVDIILPGMSGGGFTQLQIKGSNGATISPTNESGLNIWTESMVAPTTLDGILTLRCYFDCNAWNGSAWVRVNPNPGSFAVYSINKNIAAVNGYTLLAPTTSDLTTPSVPYIANSGQHIGIHELFDATDVAAIDTAEEMQQLFNGTITTRYSWRSSNNPWDKYISFKDVNGVIASFTPPLQLVYSDDGGEHYIEYQGFRQLHIPGQCYSRDTHEPTRCGEGRNIIWEPDFTIPTGTQLTSLDSGDTNAYFVKQLDVSQNQVPLSAGAEKTACINALQATMTLAGALTLPDASNWSAPDLGTKPSAGNVPKVIVGVKQ